MIDYTLIRSKRKTAAIYVRRGSVEVRAPLKMAKQDIDRFVASKEKWIVGKLAISNEQAAKRESFKLDYGSLITYCGRQYPIEAKEGKRTGFDGERFYVPPNLTSEQIKSACIKTYKKLAKPNLTDRTIDFARKMSVNPSSIRITDARYRWGSCSGKKSLNFAWRLIMADDDLIDYVIVHELAHLTEMNHSAQFWKIVEGVMPDHVERRARLKELHLKFADENW